VNTTTSASGSQPTCSTKKDRISRTPSKSQKNKVEAHTRNVNSSLNKMICVVKSKGTATVQQSKLNMNYDVTCGKCNGCMLSSNHDLCALNVNNEVKASSKSKYIKKNSKRKVSKPTSKVFNKTGYIWRPTVRTFTIVGNASSKLFSGIWTPGAPSIYPKIALSSPISQFYDSNIEVAFRQHTCYVRNLERVDLLTGSRGNNLYTLSLGDMMASSPICLLSKASKTKSWLWHRRLSHLNFGSINHLARQSLVQGFPKLKFEKDHLCLACAMGKIKKKIYKPKSEDTNQEKLYLLHMDLYGSMRVVSINGKNVDHPASEVIALIAEVVAPKPTASTSSPSSTTVDQDAPLPSNSQTTTKTQSSIIFGDVKDDNHDLDVVHMNTDSFFGIPIPEVSSDQSSSMDSNHTVVHPDH
nr:integrase, catalytic region, zinc finger, CCHC-type, peptidase aspartic, catalytic [Tanacetum cinerariifolium]